MYRKVLKQLLYGSFYLVVLGAIGWGLYQWMIRPAPTCFDEHKNQGEEEVDCGGPCESCALRHLLPIRTIPSVVFGSPDDTSAILLIQFQNPNANYGATRLTYAVNFFGAQDELLYSYHDTTFIYPSESKFHIDAQLPVKAARVKRTEVALSDIEWKSLEEFKKPQVQVRQIVSKIEERAAGPSEIITGILGNENAFPIARATVDALLFNDLGALISVSKTVVENIGPGQEAPFTIQVPIAEANVDRLQAPRLFVEIER